MTADELRKRFPNASAAFIAANSDHTPRLRAGDPKPVEGKSLERRVPREETRRVRTRIIFRIYSVRPADWDGYHVKPIQDCLGYAALLDGDDWDLLEGQVISEKVHTKAEEKTMIEIYEPSR